MTNYVGELVQHDTSIHMWAPEAGVRWYLITSLDDHSLRILYGDLWEKESSWAHIVAAKAVMTEFGCPLNYYVDNHSIFRYIEKRDSIHRKFEKSEGEATVQWKEVLKDLNVGVIHALSSSAKGKVERPYQWLQDHIVRICVREGIRKIEEAREVLYREIHLYNHRRVHSTTQEIPALRYNRAIQEKRSVIRKFQIPKPYETAEDIFCYRLIRVVNGYRRISVDNLQMGVSGVPIGEDVELRISFNATTQMALIRFWYKGRCVGQQQVKVEDLKKVRF